MSYRVTLILNNLNFALRLNDTKLQPMIEFVTNKLVTYSLTYNKYARRLIRTVDKSYYTYDSKKNLYRFPIKTISNVMKAMGQYGVTRDDIEIINNTNIDTDIVNFNLNKKYIPRDYQIEYQDAVINNLNKKIFLIDAMTGAGKGLIASMIMSKLKMRVAAILLPKFINKWILDAKEYLGVTDEEIYIVQGSESLINLMLEENVDYKIIIFSITTLTYYLSDYETNKYDYPITPDQLFDHLKIGVMFNDETHLCFHAITKCTLYFNPFYFIGSTATLDSNQRDIKRMYEIIIPLENRVSNLVKVEPYTYTK